MERRNSRVKDYRVDSLEAGKGGDSIPDKPLIILARHGQTESNRDGRVMGRSDSPLTSEGRRTPAALAEALKKERIELILSSPLGRAAATAKIYADAIQAPWTVVDAMAELACGEWEGKLRQEVVQPGGRLRNTWWETPPGGESCADGEERVRPLIRKLRSDREETRVLLVGHASVNRVFLKVRLDLAPDVALRIACPHDRVYLPGSDGEIWNRSATGEDSEGLLFEEP